MNKNLNPFARLLSAYAELRGMSQQAVADAIAARYGIHRSRTAVKFTVTGCGDDPFYGTRVRKGETPLALLIAAVLDIPQQEQMRAWEALWDVRLEDARKSGQEFIMAREAYIRYFTLIPLTLRKQAAFVAQKRALLDFSAHQEAAVG